jgi:hypothetical protein
MRSRVARCSLHLSDVTSNPALQRSVNSRLWRLLPPAELWRWASLHMYGMCDSGGDSLRLDGLRRATAGLVFSTTTKGCGHGAQGKRATQADG